MRLKHFKLWLRRLKMVWVNNRKTKRHVQTGPVLIRAGFYYNKLPAERGSVCYNKLLAERGSVA